MGTPRLVPEKKKNSETARAGAQNAVHVHWMDGFRLQTGTLSRASLSQQPVLAGSEGTAMVRPREEGKRGGKEQEGGRARGGSHDVELLPQTPAQCRDAVLGARVARHKALVEALTPWPMSQCISGLLV